MCNNIVELKKQPVRNATRSNNRCLSEEADELCLIFIEGFLNEVDFMLANK